MKGSDCTPEQLKSARDFITDRARAPIPEDEIITISLDNFARIVAWYGALRYIAGKTGDGGTLAKPGPIDSKKSGGGE